MAHLCHDRTVKFEVLRIDLGDPAVYLNEVSIAPPLLLTLQRIDAALVGNNGFSEVVPTDPLQRYLVFAKQHSRRIAVVHICLRLRKCCRGKQ